MKFYKTYEPIGKNIIDPIVNSRFDPRLRQYKELKNEKGTFYNEVIEIFRTENFRVFENQRTLKRYYLNY